MSLHGRAGAQPDLGPSPSLPQPSLPSLQPAEQPAEQAQEPPAAPTQQRSDARFELNIESVQGVLAVERLHGWLLYDRQGQNPIAVELVKPVGGPTMHRWFYLIPAQGQPVALIHKSEAARFAHVPGRKIEYSDHRDFLQSLKSMLKGMKHVAMEYSPKAALPDLSRVDAGTIEMVREQRVQVRSSAELVQLTKALWGSRERLSHYLAVHHLTQLRKAALAFVAGQIEQNALITEYDVQQFLLRGYETRGLIGPPPVVATGINAADPLYKPLARRSTAIRRGDLLLLDMRARVDNGERTIYANTVWMAYVGDDVPVRLARAFTSLAQARDAAVGLVQERVRRRRVVKGYEVDRAARTVLDNAGLGDAFLHRAGHSLDTDAEGGGANLDDYETRDARALLVGTGFSVAPGIYIKGEFGMRSSANIYIDRQGVEITTPQQFEISAIFKK